jgi:rod shape-determining protein MreD
VAFLGVHPNLLLLFATSWVLIRGLNEGLLIGLIGGILLDVSSAAPFGAAILSLSLGISLAALGEVNVFQGAWLLKYLVIAGATLLFNLVFVLVLRLSGYDTSLGQSLGRVVLLELLIHVALMPVVYGSVKWLCKRIEPPTVEF